MERGNAYTPEFRHALSRSIQTSQRVLQPFRLRLHEFVRAYVGAEWGDDPDPSRKSTPVNLLQLTADVYTMALAANRPRILVHTQYPHLSGFAKRFQVATNNLIQEIHLEETLRRIVLDAFFSVGIAKVYLAPSGKISLPNPEMPRDPGPGAPPEELERYREAVRQGIAPNIWVDPGQPMVERISLDDFVFDTQATGWERIRFAAHTYRVPLEWVKEDDRFDPEVVKTLGPDSKYEGVKYHDGDEPLSELASRQQDQDELEPMVSLMDVWLPQEQKWAVFHHKLQGPPLLYEDWKGPETGPFHLLTFADVPDNIMPVSPAENLLAMHELVNSLMRKMAFQAKQQKVAIAFQGPQEDARRVRDARDREMVRVNNPDSIKPMAFPGADQGSAMFYQLVDGIYNKVAGNLDAMAGLGPQADTATQDTLIHSAVSKREAKMQYRVVDFTARVCRDLGWMLWVDQSKTMPGMYTEPGLTLPVEANWTPEEREGDFFDYQFDVEPYSMVYQSPQQRLTKLFDAVTRFEQSPAFQAAGGMVDYQKLADKVADYADLPELREIVTFSGVPPLPDQQGEADMPQPETTRNYVRKSVSTGGTPQGQRQSMMQELMRTRGEQMPVDIAG